MKPRIVIIGGGLSGLSSAWQLHRHGLTATLLEARSRPGGRVLSIPVDGGSFDMGPSWIWNGQPCVHRLLEHFGIGTFPQSCDGALLHQSRTGEVVHNAVLKPMMGSFRVCGGVGRLVESLAAAIPKDSIRFDSAVRKLESTPNGIHVSGVSTGGVLAVEADSIAIATPLRLSAALEFVPPIRHDSLELLKMTPTWMAGHAKFLAVYESPTWREQGLSGDILSAKGPLAEVHEATPESGSPHALLGFIGLNSETRGGLTEEELKTRCLEQLVDLLGPTAGQPTNCQVFDWSVEEFTATDSDLVSYNHHPVYGLQVPLAAPWRGRVQFIVSETANENGGLIEGAISQGLCFANSVLKQLGIDFDQIGSAEPCDPHAASMSWDWTDDQPR
ncbi:MAG: NAD(P)/FAD-dependent oxidoreductase [Planctomycetota bacterium]